MGAVTASSSFNPVPNHIRLLSRTHQLGLHPQQTHGLRIAGAEQKELAPLALLRWTFLLSTFDFPDNLPQHTQPNLSITGLHIEATDQSAQFLVS